MVETAQEVSQLNPQVLRVWAAFGFCFKSALVKCDSRLRALCAGSKQEEIKALRKLFKMRKLRPKQHLMSRFLLRPQFPLWQPHLSPRQMG